MKDILYHERLALRLFGDIVAASCIAGVIFVLLVILP